MGDARQQGHAAVEIAERRQVLGEPREPRVREGAYGVLGAGERDLVGVGLGTTVATFKSLRVFPDQTPRATVLPFERLQSRYYLGLTAKDQPGVLAQVMKVLGDQNISIASFVQHEVTGGDSVPLVLTTHRAEEGAMQNAIRQINALSQITAPAVFLRIADQPKEFAS